MYVVVMACLAVSASLLCVTSDSIWSTCVDASGNGSVAVAVVLQFLVLAMACGNRREHRWVEVALMLLAFAAFFSWARIALLTAAAFGFGDDARSTTTRVFLLCTICSAASIIVFDGAFRSSSPKASGQSKESTGDSTQ